MPKEPSAVSRRASVGSRTEGGRGKEVHPQPPKRKGGFKIGKAHKGTNGVYLGKAKQIKETLIRKAKLKKQHARELARAGYTSAAGPSGARAIEDVPDSDRDPMHDISDEMDTDPEADAIRKRPRNDVMRVDVDPQEVSSVKRGKRPASPSSSEDEGDKPTGVDSPMLISPPKDSASLVHPSRRKGALASPSSGKPPTKRRRLSDPNEVSPEKARADAKAAAKKRREASKGAWLARNRNGQPKLGRRIKAMLGKIEASMST